VRSNKLINLIYKYIRFNICYYIVGAQVVLSVLLFIFNRLEILTLSYINCILCSCLYFLSVLYLFGGLIKFSFIQKLLKFRKVIIILTTIETLMFIIRFIPIRFFLYMSSGSYIFSLFILFYAFRLLRPKKNKIYDKLSKMYFGVGLSIIGYVALLVIRIPLISVIGAFIFVILLIVYGIRLIAYKMGCFNFLHNIYE
jgi:hypothetical protein